MSKLVKTFQNSLSNFIQSIKDKVKGIILEPDKYNGGFNDEK